MDYSQQAQFDPFAQRGHSEPGEWRSLGGQQERQWGHQRAGTPPAGGCFDDEGMPSVPYDQTVPDFKYGYGNSVFIQSGSGTQSFYT